MNTQQIITILAILGLPADTDLATINAKELPLRKLTNAQRKIFGLAVADAQGIKVADNGEVTTKGGSAIKEVAIGDNFSSIYLKTEEGTLWGKTYGAIPKSKVSQFYLVLIPEILGFEPKAQEPDKAEPVYKDGGSTWEKVFEEIEGVTLRLPEEYRQEKNPTLFWQHLEVEDTVLGNYPAVEFFYEMRSKLPKACTLQVRINRTTGRVFFQKRHATHDSEPIVTSSKA